MAWPVSKSFRSPVPVSILEVTTRTRSFSDWLASGAGDLSSFPSAFLAFQDPTN